MTIFKGVNTLQDYESVESSFIIPNDGPETTHITKDLVKVRDDFTGKYKKGKLLYNGYGMKISFKDNSAENTPFLKFQYISYTTFTYEENTLSVSDTKYIFENKDDKEDFLNFLREYNKFMARIFDEVADRCLSYANLCFNNPIDGIRSFLDGLPENLFTNEFVYCALLHYFTFQDTATYKFAAFTLSEKDQVIQFLKDNSEFHNAMEEIWSAIETFKNALFQSDIKNHINEDYATCFTYFMLRRGLMEKYSSIWISQCGNVSYSGDSTDYINQCLRNHVLDNANDKDLTALTYFLMKVENSKEDFRIVLRKVKKIISNQANQTIEQPSQNQESTAIQKQETESVPENSDTLSSLLEQLNSLVGLEQVKNDVSSLINLLQIKKIREERGLKQLPMSMHLVFSGNPGTGKTTVARLLSKIYHELGVLSKGHLVEVDRSGLVAGYVGQTAIKVQEVIQEALGGILFIDEAYSLTVNRGESDFGFEAVDTLLKGMEDHRDDLIVIVAGYPDLMNEFLNSNPGLRSRFNKFINFADYTPQELMGIFKNLCDSMGYTISADCERCVKEYFEHRYATRDATFANGRDVRNYFEMAMVNQANRLSAITDISNDLLLQLELEDVQNIAL